MDIVGDEWNLYFSLPGSATNKDMYAVRHSTVPAGAWRRPRHRLTKQLSYRHKTPRTEALCLTAAPWCCIAASCTRDNICSNRVRIANPCSV